jgi:hypothetical protein
MYELKTTACDGLVKIRRVGRIKWCCTGLALRQHVEALIDLHGAEAVLAKFEEPMPEIERQVIAQAKECALAYFNAYGKGYPLRHKRRLEDWYSTVYALEVYDRDADELAQVFRTAMTAEIERLNNE